MISAFTMAILTNFGGHWVGSGQAWDQGGWASDCPQIEFHSVQHENTIDIQAGVLNCKSLKTTWKPHQVQIQGDELWYNGEKIGTISETQVHTESVSPKNKMKQIFDFEIQGDQMFYHERWTDLSGQKEYLWVKGLLKRAVTE